MFLTFLILVPVIVFALYIIVNIIIKKLKKSSEQEGPTELQEKFRTFPPEVQWTITKQFLDMIGSSTLNKMAILPSLSAISIAMVVVATLNPELIPITLLQSKIIISILLFFIPTSLIIYILDLGSGAEGALKHLESYTGIKPEEAIKSNAWDYIKGYATLFIAVIYASIVIFLLEIIWDLL